ncbi:MAG: hypothetical protein A2516_11365 [Alphaproteobacteria bacterium RIFOXYD12_FULL_60_8]|nr:MAG: hypothetical protein A2516_11365 [Alphaproteobacteria bacterium RIFOXYD12_FULL_60_8]
MDELLSYIAKDNPNAAEKILILLKQKFALLADSPRIGAKRDELLQGGLCLPVGSYVIFYRQLSDHVEIVRILHGAGDLDTLFD